MTNWATIAQFTSAIGTFAWAGASYASVRSSRRAVRASELSLLAA